MSWEDEDYIEDDFDLDNDCDFDDEDEDDWDESFFDDGTDSDDEEMYEECSECGGNWFRCGCDTDD